MSRRNQETENWVGLLLSLSRSVYLFSAALKQVGGTRWGFIDKEGKFILPPTYESAQGFQENGLAIVRLNDAAGIINSDGYFIVNPKYDSIQAFSEGRAVVIDEQGFKVIDESGKVITHKAYSIASDYKEGRSVVAISEIDGNSVYGFLNRWGKEVIPLEYVQAENFEAGKSLVKMKNNKYALINLTGKVLMEYPYPFVGAYGEGLLAFRKDTDGKLGYMDEQGKIIIEPQFSMGQPFIDGRAIVNTSDDLDANYGLIDRQGKYILKPNYSLLLNLNEDRYAVGKAIDPKRPYIGTKYAIADSKGYLLTGFLYNGVSTYHNAIASAYDDNFTFFIDKRGKRMEHLPKIAGNGTLIFEKNMIKGEIDFRIIYFDKRGHLVWEQNSIIPLSDQYAVIEHKYRPNKDYLVYYPQLKGVKNQTKVNELLKELSGVKDIPPHTQLESNYMGDFEVTFFRKNLLVILIEGYDYPFGAAHGMPIKKYVHIDVKSGEIYQLKDFFLPDSPYVKVISDIIDEQIKDNEKYSYLFPDAYKGIKPDQPFFISDNGLNLYFTPYDIAPYAAGFPTFTIPFDKLSGIINKEGGFWKSFQ
jgi:hypothetical protein